METLKEREQRIAHLEAERASRPRAAGVWPTPDDVGTGLLPVEIAPGRGNLDYTSGFVPTYPTALRMVGRTVSFSRLFMSQAWVAAAVMRMMTWAVRVPLKAYRKTGSDLADRQRLLVGDHPIADAIARPYERGNQAQFVMNALGPILVHGNSVMRVDSGAQDTVTFRPKDWRFSMPIMPFRDEILGFKFDIDTPKVSQEVSIDEILHISWWSPTGPIGVSPLQQLGVTLQIEDAAQRWQRAQLQNGARPPSAVVASDEFLGLEPAERWQLIGQLRKDIQNIYTGPESAGVPALLPPGLDWKNVGHTSVEAELIDQRKIAREEVAAVYLIPPPMLGILDRATYSNIEIQRQMTYTDCLGPPLALIEQAINAQIIRDLLKEDDIFVEFDFGGVLRGDRLQEIDALRDAIATALMTPNEGRGVLNLKRSDDPSMDEFYLPANNLQPVGSPTTPNVGNVNVPNESPDWSPDPQPPDPQRGNAKYRKSRQTPVWLPSSAIDMESA